MTDQSSGAASQPAVTSIRDSIAAAIDELEPAAEMPSSSGTSETTGKAPGETEAAASDKPAASGERQRDPATGRFAKKEGEGESAEKPQPETKVETKPTTEQKPAVTANATEPPAHWSADDKAFAKKLPAELQAEYIDRFKRFEAGFTPKLQRAAALEKDYGEVDNHFAPYAQQMAAQGWTKGSLIKAWADVELALAKDPVAQIREIARHYKVDLNALAGGGAAQSGTATLVDTNGAAPQAADPAVKALQEQLTALTQTVTGFTQAEQRRVQQAQDAATQTTFNDIRAFAEAKGEDGKLSHPFFNDVVNDLIRLAQVERSAGRMPKLQDLYDTAVWANPQTRAQQIAANTEQAKAQAKAEAEEAQRQRAAEAKAKAGAARRAGSSVTGAPSGSGQAAMPKSKGSLRQDILAAADDAEA